MEIAIASRVRLASCWPVRPAGARGARRGGDRRASARWGLTKIVRVAAYTPEKVAHSSYPGHKVHRGAGSRESLACYYTFPTNDESLHRVVHRALRCRRRRHLEWSAQHRSSTSIAEDAHGEAEAEEDDEAEERTEGFRDPFRQRADLLDGLGGPVRRWR